MGTSGDVHGRAEHVYRSNHDRGYEQTLKKRIVDLEGENERLRPVVEWAAREPCLCHPANKADGAECLKDAADKALAPDSATEAEPARWHEMMRDFSPEVCWRYVAEEFVCIMKRGHDGGKHEPPEATS